LRGRRRQGDCANAVEYARTLDRACNPGLQVHNGDRQEEGIEAGENSSLTSKDNCHERGD